MAKYMKYGVGTKAYIDGFGGLVPCTVIKVLKRSNGRIIGDHRSNRGRR